MSQVLSPHWAIIRGEIKQVVLINKTNIFQRLKTHSNHHLNNSSHLRFKLLNHNCRVNLYICFYIFPGVVYLLIIKFLSHFYKARNFEILYNPHFLQSHQLFCHHLAGLGEPLRLELLLLLLANTFLGFMSILLIPNMEH